MARCGCSTECLCVLIDGDCTTVAGSGSVAAPYQTNIAIDPDLDNQIECRVDGLFIEPEITVLDSDCIDLSGVGSAANPLTADLVPSPDVGNIFECRPNGIFVPPTSLGTMCRASIEMVALQIIAPSAGAGIPSASPVFYDTLIGLADPCLYVDISTGSLRFIVPVGLDGWHLISMQERDDPGGTNLNTSVGIQIRVNGAVVASERFERVFATQKVLNCTSEIELVAGDIVEGYFNITSTAGATAPHPIGPGGAGFPRFLTITRLSP